MDFWHRTAQSGPTGTASEASCLLISIAEHACLKYSGRIGRSAAAKSLDETAVRLAVTAHVRHAETDYGRLLARGLERFEARAEVEPGVQRVLAAWQTRR